MRSADARRAVASGTLTADAAVEALLVSGDHTWNSQATCPECGTSFWCSPLDPSDDTKLGNANTCSEPCQVMRNTTIFELDGGRTIHSVSDFTPETLRGLLASAGLGTMIGQKGRKS